MKPKHLLALAVLLAGLAPSLTAAQNRAPSQPTEQQKLKERIDALQAEVKELKEKSDDAAKERAYVERTQKEVKEYYEKAFDTQVKFLEWLIVLVAAVPIVVGLFGYRTVDRIIDHAVSKTTTDLKERFDEKLAAEVKTLKDSNAAQMKQLENTLTLRTDAVERDLGIRSGYGFYFVQGLAFGIGQQYAEALDNFSMALEVYKEGKSRHLFPKNVANAILNNIFHTIEEANPKTFKETAQKELANPIYGGLEEELALSALDILWLGPLLKERNQAPLASHPATPTAAEESLSPTPATEKAQSAKPDESKNK